MGRSMAVAAGPASLGGVRTAAPQLAPTRVRQYARLLGVFAVLLAAALVAVHPDTLTLQQALQAAAIGVLGLVPAFLYLRRGAVESVPLLPLHGVFYAVAFGFTVFFPGLNWMGTGKRPVSECLWLALAGVLSLYAGYAAAGPLWRGLRPVRIRMQASPAALRAWAWVFFAAHLAHQYVPRIASISSLPHLLYPLGWLAMGLLFLQHLRRELPTAHRLLFFGVALPAELFSRFVTGALYEFFMVFAFLMLIYWQMRRRILWVLLAALVGLFALLNPVKFRYREALKVMPSEAGPLAKAETFLSVTAAHYAGRREEEATEIAATSSLNRLCHVPVFAFTVENTPGLVPYWGGQTYTYFLAGLVPRALWPEKPGAAFGNDFGHRYGILAPGVYDTSINLPWLVEFYVNFGPWAVLLGMALVGLALRLLARKLDNPAANDCEYVLGLTLCFQLFWGESNLAIMWGGLLQTSIALYVVLTVAARRFRW
jgi:hypothetical protein